MIKQSDTPLSQICLEILPEVPNRNSNAVANEIGRELFDDLKNQGYRIEPAYTGEMGGNVFLIWLAMLVPTVGPVVTGALKDALANKSIENAIDMITHMVKKVKTSKHKALPVAVEVKSPHTAPINTDGPLGEALE